MAGVLLLLAFALSAAHFALLGWLVGSLLQRRSLILALEGAVFVNGFVLPFRAVHLRLFSLRQLLLLLALLDQMLLLLLKLLEQLLLLEQNLLLLRFLRDRFLHFVSCIYLPDFLLQALNFVLKHF